MSDAAYYQRRLEEERKLAETAADSDLAKAHEEKAELYRKMIDALERHSEN